MNDQIVNEAARARRAANETSVVKALQSELQGYVQRGDRQRASEVRNQLSEHGVRSVSGDDEDGDLDGDDDGVLGDDDLIDFDELVTLLRDLLGELRARKGAPTISNTYVSDAASREISADEKAKNEAPKPSEPTDPAVTKTEASPSSDEVKPTEKPAEDAAKARRSARSTVPAPSDTAKKD